MSKIKLPALWFDDFKTTDADGIFLANAYPEDGNTNVGVSQAAIVEIISTHLSGVDIDATSVVIGGSQAMLNGVWQPGFTGSSADPLSPHDYRLTIVHDADWLSEQVIEVQVTSRTLDSAYALTESYSFTVEDITKPKLVSVTAIGAKKIRVVFDEAMLRTSASGTNDALNPNNYAFAFVPANDRDAGVWVAASSVAEVSSTTFDITTDIVLSFGKTYQLTCDDIADAAANANLLDDDYRSAEFTAWVPTNWPSTRRFSIWYDLLSEKDREGDIHGDLERMCSVWQDVVDVKLWEIDNFDDLWDVDRMPESFCDAQLADLGNPFDFDMTLTQKRKLIDLLIPSYAQRGTEDAIVNMARFFMGITVTVTAYNGNEEVWVLEDISVEDVSGSEIGLGIDSVIGPSAGTPELYTFEVYSGVVLTTDQRRTLALIIEEVKCAHEHYVIKDPSDATVYDPWEIGLSQMGVDTYLHE